MENEFKPVYDLFVNLIAAGFSENQALRLIAHYLFTLGTMPQQFGTAAGESDA